MKEFTIWEILRKQWWWEWSDRLLSPIKVYIKQYRNLLSFTYWNNVDPHILSPTTNRFLGTGIYPNHTNKPIPNWPNLCLFDVMHFLWSQYRYGVCSIGETEVIHETILGVDIRGTQQMRARILMLLSLLTLNRSTYSVFRRKGQAWSLSEAGTKSIQSGPDIMGV